MSSNRNRTLDSDRDLEDDSIAPRHSTRATRRTPLLGLLVVVLLLPLLILFDGAISRWAVDFQERYLIGDILHELRMLQQFGQGASVLLLAWAIWLLQPALRRRLLDWILAVVVAAVAGFMMKILIGRPRPKFDDPHRFLGPFGVYPIPGESQDRHAWEIGGGISSDLWSMPSNHTLFAVVMSSMLWVWYPRLRPLAVLMASLVGLARIFFGAHYLSDVVVGAVLGIVIAVPIARGHLGVRLMDRIWVQLINRQAQPALPALLAHERRLSK